MKRFMLFMLTAALAVAMPSYLAAGEGKKPQRPKPPVQAKAPQFDAKVIFARLDKDKDGKLNFEEFSVGLRHFHQMLAAKAPQMQMHKVQAFAGKCMAEGPWAKCQPGVKVKVAVKKGPCGPQGCPMMAKGPQKGHPGKQFAKGPQQGKPGQFAWGQFQGKCPQGKQFAKGPQMGHPGKQFAKGPQKGHHGMYAWGQFQGKCPQGKQFAKGPQKGHPGQQFAKGCPCPMQFGKCPCCPCGKQFAKGPQMGHHGKQFAQGPWGMKPPMGPPMPHWGMKPGMGPWGMGMPHMAHGNFKPGMGGPHWGMMPGPMPGMKPGMGPGPMPAFGQKPMAKKAPAMKKPGPKPDFKRPAPPQQPKPEGKTNLERKVAELEMRLTAVERQQAAILTAIQEQQATMMAALQKTNELVTAKLVSMGRDTERVRPQWDKAKAEQKSRETAKAGQKAKHRPQPSHGERN